MNAQQLHLILDNYGRHKHPAVKAWLAARPNYHLHFTPTSSSWLNLVERFFSEITQRRIRRGTFSSVPALTNAITEYIRDRNKNPKPFTWVASADQIVRKVRRCLAILEAAHQLASTAIVSKGRTLRGSTLAQESLSAYFIHDWTFGPIISDFEHARLVGLTPIGRATIQVLAMNAEDLLPFSR